MTRISVIIPTYNRKIYLLECLETVFAQSYSPYEVIVVDDGSTDGTIEAVEKFGRGVQVIQQANRGPGAARNRGASIAGGDYLAFLDSDDLWLPWTLATFVRLIEHHGNPALLAGKLLNFTHQSELSRLVFQRPIGTSYPDYLSSHAECHFCGSGMIAVKRDIFQRAGGFVQDCLNAEDHDLALRLGTQDGFVQIREPVTLCYRRHACNQTTDFDKTLAGLQRLVTKEKAGHYPGGNQRGLARKRIIATSVRAAVVAAAIAGKAIDAAPLYFSTFGWNLRFGRVAYLAAVPILAAYKKILGT